MKAYHISHDDLSKLRDNFYDLIHTVEVEPIIRKEINKEVTEIEDIILKTFNEE